MIQNIEPHIFKNEYRTNVSAAADDFLIIYRDGKIRLNDDLSIPLIGEYNLKNYLYLFTIDKHNVFLYLAEDNKDNFYDLSFIRKNADLGKTEMFMLFTAYHLANWYENNRYCGRCGNELVPDKKERALFCPICHNKIYPRINPAVIVGIINDDKILITRYRLGYGGSALVAGFSEIGEEAEETVRREVKEETGLKVKNIRYYKSQPWGIAQDLLMGFYCDVDGDDEILMDENELKYASWTKREDIELQEDDFSLTNEMMKRFKEGKKC